MDSSGRQERYSMYKLTVTAAGGLWLERGVEHVRIASKIGFYWGPKGVAYTLRTKDAQVRVW